MKMNNNTPLSAPFASGVNCGIQTTGTPAVQIAGILTTCTCSTIQPSASISALTTSTAVIPSLPLHSVVSDSLGSVVTTAAVGSHPVSSCSQSSSSSSVSYTPQFKSGSANVLSASIHTHSVPTLTSALAWSSSAFTCTSTTSIPSTTTTCTRNSVGSSVPTSQMSNPVSVSVPSGSVVTIPATITVCTAATSVHTYGTTDDHVEFARTSRAIVDLGSDIMRYLLMQNILPIDLPKEVTKVDRKGYPLVRLNQYQQSLIGNSPRIGYKEFDITLLYTLLRYVIKIIHKCGIR